ncbi:MAG: undecaprenyl-diphosphate phosphatase [Elusimicrobiota bacterium]
MTFFESGLLGFLQGLTEFLPVSSSGHLVVFQKLLKVSEQIEFDIFLHFATLLAVLVFFRTDVTEVIKGIFRKSSGGRKVFVGILIGSIPTAIIGLVFKDFFEKQFSQPRTVSVMWLVSAFVIWLASKFSKSDVFDKSCDSTKITDFFIIGTVQGLAIMPGISRSGMTIAAALLLGFNRLWAFRYSMLLSIPAILGAGLLELKSIDININIFTGGFIAMFSGLLALYILAKTLTVRKFHIFSYYLLIVGILGLIFL